MKRARVKIVQCKVSELEDADYNSRTIADAALSGLAASMEQFGWLSYPVVNRRARNRRRIVGGHRRVQIAREKGEEIIPCIEVRLDDTTEVAANLALNNDAIQGRFVPELTRKLLEEVRTALGDTAATVLKLDVLAKEVAVKPHGRRGAKEDVKRGRRADEDAVPTPRTETVSRRNTFYRLGRHIIFCGRPSVTSNPSIFKLGAPVASVTVCHDKGSLTNGHIDSLIGPMMSASGDLWVATTNRNRDAIMNRLSVFGATVWGIRLWYPPLPAPGATPHQEVGFPIICASVPDHVVKSSRTSDTCKLTKGTKATPPVEVLVGCMDISSRDGDVIFDPAIGSGGSLIAAEKTGRTLIGYAWTTREMDALRSRWTEYACDEGADWTVETKECTP